MPSTVAQMMDALATQLQTTLCGTVGTPPIPNLQVDGRLVPNPTTPALDVYPSDPFTESLGYGIGNREYWFNVRARVSTADSEGGQDLLLSMMDAQAATSVEQAIWDVTTVDVKQVEGPSAYGLFTGPNGDNLLGCVWRVRVMP